MGRAKRAILNSKFNSKLPLPLGARFVLFSAFQFNRLLSRRGGPPIRSNDFTRMIWLANLTFQNCPCLWQAILDKPPELFWRIQATGAWTL
jgi:hypothetical protein